jgi:hypothetical protein
MEEIFFEQAADFCGAVRRSLGGGEPAFDFGSEVVMGADGLDLEVSVAKELQQFAERKRADMRRVAQNFPAAMISGAAGMLACENVFDKDGAAAA